MSKTNVNLLPDSKQVRLRLERTRKITQSISILSLTVAFGVVVVLFATDYGFSKRIDTIQGRIDKNIKTLRDDESLQKNLTIQSQLQGIVQLEASKIYQSNAIDALEYSIIEGSTISAFKFNGSEGAFEITGQANSVNLVDSQIKSIKAMQFSTDNLEDLDVEDAVFADVYTRVFSSSVSIDDSFNVFYIIEGEINPAILKSAITALRINPDAVGDLVTPKPIYIIGDKKSEIDQSTETNPANIFDAPSGGDDE